MERIKSYIEELFRDYEETEELKNLKEEMTSDFIEKYNDLKKEGLSEEEASSKVLESLGDTKELFEGFKKKRKDTNQYYNFDMEKEYKFDVDFSRVEANTDIFSLDVNETSSEETTVEIFGDDEILSRYLTRIEITDGVLYIMFKKVHHYINFGFTARRAEVKIRIPSRLLNENMKSISLSTTSGSVTCDNLKSKEISIKSVSGSIKSEATVGEEIFFKTISGSIKTEKIGARKLSYDTVSGSLKICGIFGEKVGLNSVSGSLHITSMKGKNLNLTSVSGSIKFEDIECDKVETSSVSGSTKFEGTIFKKCIMSSTSGSIKGEIQCIEDQFETLECSTMSGGINLLVPKFLTDPFDFKKGFMNRSIVAGPNGSVNLKSSSGSVKLNNFND